MGKFALLIGVGEYQSSELQNLAAAIPDVRAIEKVLIDPAIADFAQTDVMVLLNPEPQQMREAIERLFANRQKDDLLFLYFSGHGVVDDYGKFHLTCAKTDRGILNSTAIPATFVHGLMEGCRSQRQVVILDSCFSGAFAKDMRAKGESVNLQPQLGGKGRAVLTSSSATEYSFEQKEAALSVYTEYVVEGLRTGIADRDEDGWISIDELHEFAREKVREVAPAMQPKIYAVEEGYKIVFAKASIGVQKEIKYLAPERRIFFRILNPKRSAYIMVTGGTIIALLYLKLIQPPTTSISHTIPTQTSSIPSITEAENILAKGGEKYSNKDFQGAIESADKAIELNPFFALAYSNRGVAYSSLGNHRRAIEDYNKAIQIDQNWGNTGLWVTYSERGNSRNALGDRKGAIEDYDKATQIKPDFSLVYYNRGNVRSSLGDKKGAIEDYNQAIQIDANWGYASNSYFGLSTAYNQRGFILNELGDKKSAIEDYTKAIQLKFDYAEAYGNRGFAYNDLGDKKSAIADFQKAADFFLNQGKTQDYQRAFEQIRKTQ